MKIRLKAMTISLTASLAILFVVHFLTSKISETFFGKIYEAFMTHFSYQYEFISIVCLFYSVLVFLLFNFLARKTWLCWVCSAFAVIIAPWGAALCVEFYYIGASDFSSAFLLSFAIGYAVISMSAPYNVIGALIAIPGAVGLARLLTARAKSGAVASPAKLPFVP